MIDLLKNGAPSVLDSEGQTPLHLAAAAGHLSLVEALLQAGCDVSVQDFVSVLLLLLLYLIKYHVWQKHFCCIFYLAQATFLLR